MLTEASTYLLPSLPLPLSPILPTPIPNSDPDSISCLLTHSPSFPRVMSSPYLGMDGGCLELVSTAHSDVDAAGIGDPVLGHAGDALPVCVVRGSTAFILTEEGWGEVATLWNLHSNSEMRIFHPTSPPFQPSHSLPSAICPKWWPFCCL